MKRLNIFIALSAVLLFASCGNGLQKPVEAEKGRVSFFLEVNGVKTNKNQARTIALDQREDILKDFNFTALLVNEEDSSKNKSQTGSFQEISNYLHDVSLAKGRWTLTVNGVMRGKDSKLSGSTDFTVGGREVVFVLKLAFSGSEKGSIKYRFEPPYIVELPIVNKIILYPLQKFLAGTYEEEDLITYFYPDYQPEVTEPDASELLKFEIEEPEEMGSDVDPDDPNPVNPNPDTIVLKDIAPGEYYLELWDYESSVFNDIAYVYPGLTSKGVVDTGKSRYVLDLQCGNIQGSGLEDIGDFFTDGIAYLPGYDNNPIPVRPGYMLTGWYDTPEDPDFGLAPRVPLDQKLLTQETEFGNGINRIGVHTLYAGWKKADIPEELMNKNLFLKKGTGDGIYIVKGNFNNKFEYSGYSVSDIPQSYVVVGDLIYWIDQPKLCFVDIETLEQDENKNEFYYMSENQIEIPALPEHEEDSNEARALYYDGGNILYALCLTEGGDGEAGIWNLVKITLPEYTGETPVAELIAIEEEDSRPTSSLYDYWIDSDSNRRIVSINFVIKEGKMYVQSCFSAGQDILNRAQLAAFNIDVSSKAFNMAGGIKELSEIYQPTKYGVDSREHHEGEDLLSNVTVQDMYVDNTGIYLLIRDTSITWNGTGPQDTLVSTGAIVALDFDLNVIKTYGKAEAKEFPYIKNGTQEFVSVLSVAHEYDTSCFAEPYKLLAVYDRKFIFQERGIFCYLSDNRQKRYKVKQFLNRVTVFDLDKECITYTQVTDTDIGEDSSIIDVYNEVGASCFSFDN